MSYQIEKDIPLPKRTGRPKKYPINIEELQVGEMIKVPMAEDNRLPLLYCPYDSNP